jgi:hypothetical protein
LLATFTAPESRRTARTWALALAFALLYKPLSPVAFGYHDHPLILVWAINISLVIEWILEARRLVPPVQVLAVLVVLLESVPGLPTYCDLARSAQAALPLIRGVEPPEPPIGCPLALPSVRRGRPTASWEDYRAVLDHLRRTTSSRTRVANLLQGHPPIPAINGPVGRLTAFPCAEGLQWLRWVAPDLEGRFARALVRPRDAVVVWVPTESEFPRLMLTVRECYRPEARFGAIEVWRRKPEDSPRDCSPVEAGFFERPARLLPPQGPKKPKTYAPQ